MNAALSATGHAPLRPGSPTPRRPGFPSPSRLKFPSPGRPEFPSPRLPSFPQPGCPRFLTPHSSFLSPRHPSFPSPRRPGFPQTPHPLTDQFLGEGPLREELLRNRWGFPAPSPSFKAPYQQGFSFQGLSSVAQSCPTLCDPWTAALQASLLKWVTTLIMTLTGVKYTILTTLKRAILWH